MSGWPRRTFEFGRRWMDRLERGFLALFMSSMVVLAALQILLRNLWKTGFPWAEPLLGMGLLWLTMLGALAAAGLGRHLAIDLATALLPRKWSVWIGRATSLFAAVVCGVLAWAAGRYVGFQRDMGMGELLGWPVWNYYGIIPVACWLMSLRFALRALVPATWLPSPAAEGLPGEGRVEA